MDGFEVPQSLQEERQNLEAAIAGLRRTLKAIKVPPSSVRPVDIYTLKCCVQFRNAASQRGC